jgi:hypothetical protein
MRRRDGCDEFGDGLPARLDPSRPPLRKDEAHPRSKIKIPAPSGGVSQLVFDRRQVLVKMPHRNKRCEIRMVGEEDWTLAICGRAAGNDVYPANPILRRKAEQTDKNVVRPRVVIRKYGADLPCLVCKRRRLTPVQYIILLCFHTLRTTTSPLSDVAHKDRPRALEAASGAI